MGLFFNSDTQNKKDQILVEIAAINKSLRDVATIIDNQGFNYSSINSINTVISRIESNVQRMSNTVQSMSDSQLSGFMVPWMDGRYIGIMIWIASYGTMMNETVFEMEKYIG